MKYTVRYTREGAREREIVFRDGSIYRSFFDSMKPVDSEMGEIIIQILLDYGIDPDGDSDYAKHIKWEETTDSLWEGLKCWNLDSVASLVAFFFILEENEKRKYLAPTPQPHQREEEEFVYTEEYIYHRDGLEICQRLKYLENVKFYVNFYPRDMENEKLFKSPMYLHYKNSNTMFWGIFGRLYASEGKKNNFIKNSLYPIIRTDYWPPEKCFFPILFRDFMTVEHNLCNAMHNSIPDNKSLHYELKYEKDGLWEQSLTMDGIKYCIEPWESDETDEAVMKILAAYGFDADKDADEEIAKILEDAANPEVHLASPVLSQNLWSIPGVVNKIWALFEFCSKRELSQEAICQQAEQCYKIQENRVVFKLTIDCTSYGMVLRQSLRRKGFSANESENIIPFDEKKWTNEKVLAPDEMYKDVHIYYGILGSALEEKNKKPISFMGEIELPGLIRFLYQN